MTAPASGAVTPGAGASKRGRAGVPSYARRTCATCFTPKPAASFRVEATRVRYWPDCADCREAALLARVAPVLPEARRRYEAGVAFAEIRALLRVADPTARRLVADCNHQRRRNAMQAARRKRAVGAPATTFHGRRMLVAPVSGTVTIRCHVCTLPRVVPLATPGRCGRCGADGAVTTEAA